MGMWKKLFVLSIVIAAFAVMIMFFFPNHINEIQQNDVILNWSSTLNSYSRWALTALGLSAQPKQVIKSTHSRSKDSQRLFTETELKQHDGSDKKKGVYLAFLGHVFDVSKGEQHYGIGGGYSFFSGRDASRAYVTGNFEEEGLISDVSDLTSQDYLGLEHWMGFYKKEYKIIGKLIGPYFDENGDPTAYSHKVTSWITQALAQKEESDKLNQYFPGCNSEYFPETGSRVWCTTKSGGIERTWIGVPRQMYTPGRLGSRCVCVRNSGPPSFVYEDIENKENDNGDLNHPHLKDFKGCPSNEIFCQVPREPDE